MKSPPLLQRHRHHSVVVFLCVISPIDTFTLSFCQEEVQSGKFLSPLFITALLLTKVVRSCIDLDHHSHSLTHYSLLHRNTSRNEFKEYKTVVVGVIGAAVGTPPNLLAAPYSIPVAAVGVQFSLVQCCWPGQWRSNYYYSDNLGNNTEVCKCTPGVRAVKGAVFIRDNVSR